MESASKIVTELAEEMAKRAGVQSNQKSLMRPGDYIEDGLIRCGKCGGKRQTRIVLPGKEKRSIVVSCICECEAKAVEDKQRQVDAEEMLRRVERLKAASLIENRLKRADFRSFQSRPENEKLFRLIRNYVLNFDKMYENNQGLLLFGAVGTGKSYAAACIANELLNRRIPVIMTSFVKILQNIQGNPGEEERIMSGLNAAKLLIIDDLGAERNTDYALEKVYNIVDSRYLSGKPLILTSNLMLGDMQDNTDPRYKRIYDRIFEMCFPYQVKGRSWRVNQAADRFDNMKKMLMEG